MKIMHIIDSHTHIDFDAFNHDRDEVIQRAISSSVKSMIISATIAKRWQTIRTVCTNYPQNCFGAYGLHPMFMSEHKIEEDLLLLEDYLVKNDAIAVGEIGLDFFIAEANHKHKEQQVRLFIEQLKIASRLKLPVIIHARKSLDIILKYLRKFPEVSGIIHSFSGSQQQANQLIELGFSLSFGGVITYERATKLHNIVKHCPLESIVVETDSPDQPDQTHKNKRNEPAYILTVINKIAEIKQLSAEEVIEQTTQNALSIFKLTKEKPVNT